MKKAWIENNTVIDVASGVPSELFHPDVAMHYTTDVADSVQPGARLNLGKWENPVVIEKSADPVEVVAPKLSPIEFKLLFTAPERVAIKTSDDPVVQDFFEIVNDPRLTFVDRALKSTSDALHYLEAKALIGPGRADEMLVGTFQ